MYKQTKRRKIEKPTVQSEGPLVKSEAPMDSQDTKLAHKKPKNINQLPVDVLFEIFKHLSVSDQQAAGMVCKHWFGVSKHSAFLKNCVVKIQNRQFREERIAKNGVIPCTMELFAKSKRSFSNFDLQRIDLTQKACQKAYVKGMAKNIHQLAMYKCKVTLAYLNSMLAMSPNLHSLEFDSIDRSVTLGWEFAMTAANEAPPPVTEVTHLKWHDPEAFVSQRVFQRLLVMCPKLQSIDLKAGLQHFCSPACLALHMNSEASRAAVKGDQFITFLEKFGPQLKVIAIDELNKPYPYISSLVECATFLELEELRLANSQLIAEELNELLKVQKKLKVLHLLNIMIDGETMRIIATMTGLHELKLQQKTLVVNDASFKAIKSLSKLKSLELHSFPALTNDGFNGGLVEPEFENIEALTFSNLENITPDLFVRCIAKFNHLKVLKLMACSFYLTNDIMQTIFQHLVCLEELECEDATKVGNISFLGRSKQSGFRIDRLSNLRRANFSGMSRLNDRMLKTITNNTLQHLDISSCRNITSEGVKKLLHQLPSLEVLNLNGNPQITTRIFNYVAYQDCAPRLKDIMMKCKSDYCHL